MVGIVITFAVTFFLCFNIARILNCSRAESTVSAVCVACFIACLPWILSLERPVSPTYEQKYECRIINGSLEYMGERGWICFPSKDCPKN